MGRKIHGVDHWIVLSMPLICERERERERERFVVFMGKLTVILVMVID